MDGVNLVAQFSWLFGGLVRANGESGEAWMNSGWKALNMAPLRIAVVVGAAMTLTACISYPSEPRYSTRPTQPAGPAAAPANPYGAAGQPYLAPPAYESPPPATAPVVAIEGGALPSTSPASSAATDPYPAPSTAPVGPVTPGAAYVIQQGDTISGVGRRFQTPVQLLIDLNGLGPRGTISSGQSVILPDSAVDTGRDPYATGPSPTGVYVPDDGAAPPPPPPPSGNAALPAQTRPVVPPPPAVSTTPAAPPIAGGPIALQWPVRGDIVRRFGPAGMGERNNGVNIGASAGAQVNAAAAGRVAYVGDDLVGQGLTVLIVHASGWRTVYGHLGSATVRDGDDVRQGQQVGTVGLTAGDGRPSIHFETRHMQGDDPVAVDPLTVLPR